MPAAIEKLKASKVAKVTIGTRIAANSACPRLPPAGLLVRRRAPLAEKAAIEKKSNKAATPTAPTCRTEWRY